MDLDGGNPGTLGEIPTARGMLGVPSAHSRPVHASGAGLDRRHGSFWILAVLETTQPEPPVRSTIFGGSPGHQSVDVGERKRIAERLWHLRHAGLARGGQFAWRALSGVTWVDKSGNLWLFALG